ncbi:cupin domain-containing protein [Hoyosella subflava]|uniref:Cupin type-2 domain-containing protein n=1 Tax=Hoyosella subflava (strain DSM 45089 / JCM 17490 / NBRC 109087 / DQS3-9A1) TaxID=443218 RepID=F6EJX0_HOYSD|nr:cupin domain-containing protein [Hoyosella subflava]AEF41328.1 hypothetical protein AS9A_2881 [Hoyosella subflava DQS3-9A1]
MNSHYSAPGDGIALDTFDGIHVVKASAATTGGAYELFEVDVRPGPLVPLHTSPWGATAYVLEGTITFVSETVQHTLTRGASITITPGTPYTWNAAAPGARILAFTTGDGAGSFFADIARLPRDRTMDETMSVMAEIAHRHGVSVGTSPQSAIG